MKSIKDTLKADHDENYRQRERQPQRFDALMQRIEQAEATESTVAETANSEKTSLIKKWLNPITTWFAEHFTNHQVRLASWVVFAVIAGQTGYIVYQHQQLSAPTYHTASGEPADTATASGVQYLAIFAASVTVEQVSALLAEYGGQIHAGPQDANAYVLSFVHDVTPEQLTAIEQTGVFTFINKMEP